VRGLGAVDVQPDVAAGAGQVGIQAARAVVAEFGGALRNHVPEGAQDVRAQEAAELHVEQGQGVGADQQGGIVAGRDGEAGAAAAVEVGLDVGGADRRVAVGRRQIGPEADAAVVPGLGVGQQGERIGGGAVLDEVEAVVDVVVHVREQEGADGVAIGGEGQIDAVVAVAVRVGIDQDGVGVAGVGGQFGVDAVAEDVVVGADAGEDAVGAAGAALGEGDAVDAVAGSRDVAERVEGDGLGQNAHVVDQVQRDVAGEDGRDGGAVGGDDGDFEAVARIAVGPGVEEDAGREAVAGDVGGEAVADVARGHDGTEGLAGDVERGAEEHLAQRAGQGAQDVGGEGKKDRAAVRTVHGGRDAAVAVDVGKDVGQDADGRVVEAIDVEQEAGTDVFRRAQAGEGRDGQIVGIGAQHRAEAAVAEGFEADDGVDGGIAAAGLHHEAAGAVAVRLHVAAAREGQRQVEAEEPGGVFAELQDFRQILGGAGQADGDAVGALVDRLDAEDAVAVGDDVEQRAQGQAVFGRDDGLDAEDVVVVGGDGAGGGEELADLGGEREADQRGQAPRQRIQSVRHADDAHGNEPGILDVLDAESQIVVGGAAGEVGQGEVDVVLDVLDADDVAVGVQAGQQSHGERRILLRRQDAVAGVVHGLRILDADERPVVAVGVEQEAGSAVVVENAAGDVGVEEAAAVAGGPDFHAVEIVLHGQVVAIGQIEIAGTGQQDADFIVLGDVVEEGQVGGVVAVDADAADVVGRQAGQDDHLVGSALIRVADAHAADGGAVGHGDRGAEAEAVDDGMDAAAEGRAAVAGDQAAAAPEGGVGKQDDVFAVGPGGIVDVDVARAVDGVGALLDGGERPLRGAVAGRPGIAVHELHVGQHHVGLAGRAAGAAGIVLLERLVFQELGLLEADLRIAQDHFGQAGGSGAGFAAQARLGGAERIAAARQPAEIQRGAPARAGEPVAAGQVFVFVESGIQEEGGAHAQFGAGFPAPGVVAEIAVEVVVAAEHARFDVVGLDGQAQADFPVVAAQGLFILLEGLGGGRRRQRAGRDEVLEDVVVHGVRIAPIGRGADRLADGGLGFAGDHVALVVGIVVVRARVDPGAEQFQAEAPLVVVERARVAIVVVEIGAENHVQPGQELAIADAEIAFLLVVVDDRRARIEEQQAGAAGIPDRDEQVAETFRFRIADLEAHGQFGGRQAGGFRFDGGRRRSFLGFGFGLALGRVGRGQTEGEENENHQQRANPPSTHATSVWAMPDRPRLPGNPLPAWRAAITQKIFAPSPGDWQP